MALLCFLLDLRRLPPSLLRDLKQSLLQLANLYAVLPGRRGNQREPSEEELRPLPDRIGLCYIHRRRISLSNELNIAYSPRGKFSLRDFHHAVNNLPTDCFLLEPNNLDFTEDLDQGAPFSRLMSNETLYSWGGQDILKKVICIGFLPITNKEGLRKTLMDAAERCISVEFIVLEQNQYCHFSEDLECLVHNISDLENCILRTYLPNTSAFSGLVKRWLQDLKNDDEEPIQAIFYFKDSIMDSTNQIACNLYASYDHILDWFRDCKACRCHGLPVRKTPRNKMKNLFCTVTNHELGASELIENVIEVGEQTVLVMPSFQSFSELKKTTSPINFNVIERTKLATLDEGIMVGRSYVVIPVASQEMEAISENFDKTELNSRIFHGLCRVLFHLDQGLVCSSTLDTDSRNLMDSTFQCFYVLQPSDRGIMLLRRVAASEEIWPVHDVVPVNDMTLPQEIDKSIQVSLSKVELKDYNPLLHERGFHLKLNLFVKESLQFGSTPLEKIQNNSKHLSPEKPATTELVPREEIPPTISEGEHSSITQEWDELLFTKDMENYSPVCVAKPKFEDLNLCPAKPIIDEKTSRILERLEAPKQKSMGTLPIIKSSSSVDKSLKKPPDATSSSPTPSTSQPIKPNFQKLKRKQR